MGKTRVVFRAFCSVLALAVILIASSSDAGLIIPIVDVDPSSEYGPRPADPNIITGFDEATGENDYGLEGYGTTPSGYPKIPVFPTHVGGGAAPWTTRPG